MAKKEETKVAVNKKEKKKEAKENLAKQIAAQEEVIKELITKKRSTKDKTEKRELKKKIKDEKYKLSRIGKKDTFLSDVAAEMRLVRWPSAKEVFKYSIASLAFIIFFAVFFYGIDLLFALVKDLIS